MIAHRAGELSLTLSGSWSDGTLHRLSAEAPDGSRYIFATGREPCEAGEPAAIFDRRRRTLATALPAFVAQGERVAELAGRRVLELRFRWAAHGRPLFGHVALVLEPRAVRYLMAMCLLQFAEPCEAFLTDVLESARIDGADESLAAGPSVLEALSLAASLVVEG